MCNLFIHVDEKVAQGNHVRREFAFPWEFQDDAA